MKILIIILYFGLILSDATNTTEYVCNSENCPPDRGICIQFDKQETCFCSDTYTTYPDENIPACNYHKKKQLIAFLLEFFISYGAGHFYCENYEFAVPKMIFWIICYCLFIVLRKAIKTSEEDNTTSLIICLLAVFFLVGMLTWQIADVVLYGYNIYNDGNGIPLIPM